MTKLRFVVAVLSLSMVAFSGSVLGKSISEETRLNGQGNEEHGKGNYEAAAGYYKAALAHAPNDAVIWSNLGNAYYGLADYSNAAAAYSKSLDLKPGNEQVLHWRGWSHYRTGEYNKAILDFDKVISSQKYRSRALNGRGWSYYKKGLYRNASADFNAGVQMDPKDQETLRGRAWTNYFTGMFKEAIKDFTRALENIGPEQKAAARDALYGKALAYIGVEDRESAVLLIDKAKATAGLGDWPAILVYYLSGYTQKAWQLRGGEGAVGLELQDYAKGQTAGAEVRGARDGSPAAAAGFLEGDVVVAVNATPVRKADDCIRALIALKPGTFTETTVLREQRERKIRVRIGSAEMLVWSDPATAPLMALRKAMSEGGEVTAGDVQRAGERARKGLIQAAGGDELN